MEMDLTGMVSATIPAGESMMSPTSGAEMAKEMIAENLPKTEEAPLEPKPKKNLEFAEQFNMLARRERALQQREKAAKEAEAKYGSLSTLKDRARKEPINVLNELGLTYEDVTKTILNDNKPTTEMSLHELKEEIKALREEREKEKKDIMERETKQVSENYRNFLKSHVKGKEDYEHIDAHGDEAIDLVCSTMVEYYQQHGKVLSEDEACKLVEDYLESESDKILKLNKVQKKMGLTPVSKPHAPSEPASKEAHISRTLTNDMALRTPATGDIVKDDEKSLKNAAAVLRWQK